MPFPIIPMDAPGWLRDSNFENWCLNIAKKIRKYSSAPYVAGGNPLYLEPDMPGSVILAADTFLQKYTLLKDPLTSSPPYVAEKDVAKKLAISQFRKVSRYLSGIDGLDAGVRVELGLNPLTTQRTSTMRPETPPSLELENGGESSIIVHYHDEARGRNDRRKPKGMKFCQIRGVVLGATADGNGDNIVEINASRTPEQLVFPKRFAGMLVGVVGKWVGPSNIESQWSKQYDWRVPA